MLGDDSLKNDNQRNLYDALKSAIEKGGDLISVLNNKYLTDIDAVLSTRVTTEGSYLDHNFLTYAIKHNKLPEAKIILDFAKNSLRNLLEDKPMVGEYNTDDGSAVPVYMTALDYAREQTDKKFEKLIIDRMKRARIPVQQSQQSVGASNGAFVEVGGTPTQQGGQGQRQAQEGGSMSTFEKLMKNFRELTLEQKLFYSSLCMAIFENGKGIDDVLKDVEKDQDKKDILTASAPHSSEEERQIYNLLTFAIRNNNYLATKKILEECKQLSILEQVLTTQSLEITNNQQKRSLYALHMAIISNDIKLCTEVLDAASNEPDLLKKLFDLTLIYTNADRTETYTPLAIAEYKNNTEIIDIVKQKMREAGLKVPDQPSQQPVGTGAPFQEVRSALSPQSGQGQGQAQGLGSIEDEFIQGLIEAKNKGVDFHGSEWQELLKGIVEKPSTPKRIIDALFSQGILTTDNTVILLAEIIDINTNLLYVNSHFVEKAVKHLTSSNIQGREDIAKKAITAVHHTFDIMDKGNVQNISYLERVVQSLEPLKSNADIGKGIDAFYTKTRRILASRDPKQQKIFDELCDFVVRINEAKGAEQGQLISEFSQQLDEALKGKSSAFAEFKVDDFLTSTAVQFVLKNSNNQQCIETFLKRIMPSIASDTDKEKEIFDIVKLSLNIESIKVFFNIKKEKDSGEIDGIASDTSKYLIAQVHGMTSGKRDSNDFERLCKIKTILEFFLSEQNVKEQTKSLIQGYLNVTEEKMAKEKPFSWKAGQGQFSSPPPVGAPAPAAAQATPSTPTSLPQGVRKPFQPPVFVQAPSVADTAPARLLPFPGSAQSQPVGTDGSSPDNTSALPDYLGDQSTKKPTFWSEHRGKIAFSLCVVGSVIAGCALIAGLPYEAACAIVVIGVVITAIAVGILGKMAYEEVSEQAKIDNTTKVKAARTMLSDTFTCINPPELRNR